MTIETPRQTDCPGMWNRRPGRAIDFLTSGHIFAILPESADVRASFKPMNNKKV